MRLVNKFKNILRPPYYKLLDFYKKITAPKPLGYIFMLHRVDDFEEGHLWPNEHMKVTPDFLDKSLKELSKKYDFISIKDVNERLKSKNKRKFIVFTSDDGYKDNYTKTLPVFKKYNVPFTIYVTTNFPDKEAILWWYELEDLLLNNTAVELSNGKRFVAETYEQKCDVFLAIREEILKLDQENIVPELNKLFSKYKIDWSGKCNELCMSWDDLKKLKDEPLVTIGGHTKHHYNLKQLADEEKVSDEVKDGCNLLKEKTGIDVQVFAYPFGSPSEAGEREFKVLSKFGFKNSVIAYGGACNINNCKNKDSLPRIMFKQDFNIKELK